MRKLVTYGIVFLSLAACSTIQTHSDYDHSAAFGSYHTFAWLGEGSSGMQRSHGVRNPFNAQRIHDAINAQLLAKGLTAAPDARSADIVVNYTMGMQDRTDIQSYPVEYRGPWAWGRPYFGDGVDVRTYRQGTLSIDIFDVRTHRPVWHGWATKEITNSDIDQPGPIIQEAVAKILEKYPPQ